MWVHIIICIGILGLAAAWKTGLLKTEAVDENSKKLFVLVALAGNLTGFLVTVSGSGGIVDTRAFRLPKEENGAYEQEFLVSVDGEQAETMYVQVPQKVSAEETEEETDIPDEQEMRKKELLEAVELYNQKKNDPDYYYLPEEWEGQTFQWEEPAERSGTFLAALSILAAAAAMLKKAQDEQEKEKKRREQLLMDYPGLIMKFTLLVQAGMTVRKAFQKIGLDYRKRISGKTRCAYEEILVTCYEMDSGVAEVEAYRRFGERCGQIKYKTFATLLTQNLQKGSKRMADMLEQESLEAWDERKRKARVLGEAAATKLLVPMVLMLVVVMALIMIPAFLSFSG